MMMMAEILAVNNNQTKYLALAYSSILYANDNTTLSCIITDCLLSYFMACSCKYLLFQNVKLLQQFISPHTGMVYDPTRTGKRLSK